MISRIENPNIYTDLAGLNAISVKGRENTPEGLRQVAQQFESIFLNIMLKSMRQANSVFAEDNYLSSNELEFHQQSYDNQLSLHLSQGKGMGLAEMLYRQLINQFERTHVIEGEKQTAATDLSAVAKDPAAVANRDDNINSPNEFVQKLFSLAEQVADRLGVDPKLLLAQSALETGWGQKIIQKSNGENSHNLFGIKADARWSGDKVVVNTVEYRDGIARQEKAAFRVYNSYEESFADYVSFLQSQPRYQQALNNSTDAEKFAQSLQDAGYATDPIYAKKIARVMSSDTMTIGIGAIGIGDRG